MADSGLRFLLLQLRDRNDPIQHHELSCFARALSCDEERIEACNLLLGPPARAQLEAADAVLIGGSGDYSVVGGGPWLEPALDTMRELVETSKPTFASCWGFQAMARALGGEVVHDLARAEVGTVEFHLTAAGRADPVFGVLGEGGADSGSGRNGVFEAQIGHEDIVDVLPEQAVLLASSRTITNEGFMLPGKPIYATQFHPELSREDLLVRLRAYPKYVEQIAGVPFDEFERTCHETPAASGLLRRFVEVVFG